ncbi:MAG TPA: type IV pili methyl-accepting chemotaxis transducer N-terminal domain-containing protein, partial [Burkholderiaceae bacterium]|nr:type IV pili methyl-accepting chemotaxis transducer N-terminal domain-containing protein [Burkholderiaceae bacterium]
AGGALLAESVRHVEANLASLEKNLSKATHGDLLDAVRAPWPALKAALLVPGEAAALAEVDAQAERMLLQADRLVSALEAGAMLASLHVINVSGRQRMLSQRVAKQALLAAQLSGSASVQAREQGEQARAAFEDAMKYLRSVPLSTPDIVDALQAAGRAWTELLASLGQARGAAGQRALLDASEALLAAFEVLTERYERSMQMLMG